MDQTGKVQRERLSADIYNSSRYDSGCEQESIVCNSRRKGAPEFRKTMGRDLDTAPYDFGPKKGDVSVLTKSLLLTRTAQCVRNSNSSSHDHTQSRIKNSKTVLEAKSIDRRNNLKKELE